MRPPGRPASDSAVETRLGAARLWGASRYPYLASALFALRITPAAGVGTVAVDERWTLYVDPALAGARTTPQLGAMLVHEIGHLLRDHASRARSKGVTAASANRWRRAADAEIDDDLDHDVRDLLGTPVLPEHFGAERGRFAEDYFDLLTHDASAPGRCGSGADGVTRWWDDATGGSLPEESAELIRWHTAHEILDYARRGTVPHGWHRWAEGVVKPTVDWRTTLRAELRGACAQAAGMLDYDYTRPSRRAASAAPVVLPSLRAPVPEVAVVCDTSGSVSDRQLAQVLAEIDAIARALAPGGRSVRVVTVDAAVHGIRSVTRADQVELIGGGGTDMGVGIRTAAALRPRPSVIVVITDGRTPWPERGPRSATVVVASFGSAPPPPRWARWVQIVDGA